MAAVVLFGQVLAVGAFFAFMAGTARAIMFRRGLTLRQFGVSTLRWGAAVAVVATAVGHTASALAATGRVAYDSRDANVAMTAGAWYVVASVTATFDGDPVELSLNISAWHNSAGWFDCRTRLDTTEQTLPGGGFPFQGKTDAGTGPLQLPATYRQTLTPSAGSHTLDVQCISEVSDGWIHGWRTLSVWGVAPAPAASSSTLAGLTDVNLTSPADGAVLKYDAASSKWIDGADLTGGGSSTASQTLLCQSGDGTTGDPCLVQVAATLSADDQGRLDLLWWGIWGLVGLTLVLMVAGPWFRSWRMLR